MNFLASLFAIIVFILLAVVVIGFVIFMATLIITLIASIFTGLGVMW